MKRMHRVAAAVAGLSLAAALLMPATIRVPMTSYAAVTPSQGLETPSVMAPAKPATEGVEEEEEKRQKCHIKFFPLVKHKLDDTDLVKLQILADVDCREEVGDVLLFAEGRLLEKLSDVKDDEASLHGATIIDKHLLDAGFCVDVEIDSWWNDHETHWGQCFFDDDEILKADD